MSDNESDFWLPEEILARFDYKPGKAGNEEPHELRSMRIALRDCAVSVCLHTKRGREQALAITQLEQAYMWAVAAFCRNR